MSGLLRTAEQGPASRPAGSPSKRSPTPAAVAPGHPRAASQRRPETPPGAVGSIPVTAYIARQPRGPREVASGRIRECGSAGACSLPGAALAVGRGRAGSVSSGGGGRGLPCPTN
ncbi:unnamed protein product [Coccothraustes coccothraustes]